MAYDKTIIDIHRQIDEYSCIPSSVEMILKLLGKMQINDYQLQNEWRNNKKGSFNSFNGRTLQGLKFDLKFSNPRNSDFPIDSLFETIDNELDSGGMVIVSLQQGSNWHMYIIHEKANGEYKAFSKSLIKTIEIEDVRATIERMQGTDILIYRPIN
ncbi:MAG: hypothetical protein J7K40_08980 [candidate division Zixibacteria bacterium]|nr:hypothetical protein [candidate division Zixibacteria bacterium]